MMNEKLQIGTLTLENRFVMPPMATKKTNDGSISDELVQYYADRAGKIGLIIMEHTYVSIDGRAYEAQISIGENADEVGLKKIVDAVHAKGNTKMFAQLNHAGIKGGYEVQGEEDIKRIVQCFMDAALRAKRIGFDGVEIHGAHGYLLNQFYSPLENNRTDAYTGSTLEGRTKFSIEVIQAVRKAVGDDYPISYRFGACDYQEGGSTLEEAPLAAKKYAEAGLDMIDISGGMNGYMIKGVTEPGWFSDLSKSIKEAITIPVMVTGGVKTKEVAEEILNNHKADLIGIGRPLLVNPEAIIAEML